MSTGGMDGTRSRPPQPPTPREAWRCVARSGSICGSPMVRVRTAPTLDGRLRIAMQLTAMEGASHAVRGLPEIRDGEEAAVSAGSGRSLAVGVTRLRGAIWRQPAALRAVQAYRAASTSRG